MTQVSTNPCLPQPDRCASPVVPLFKPPLSFREVPLCEGPYPECRRPAYPRMHVTAAGTLDRAEWIKGWIMAQLTTRGSVTCDEHPLKTRSGGWWADAFRNPVGFSIGSKLWTLQWAFVTNEALLLAKAYANAALSPLLAWGIASKIAIEVSYVSCKVMQLSIAVTGPGVSTAATAQGTAMPDTGWLWQEYRKSLSEY